MRTSLGGSYHAPNLDYRETPQLQLLESRLLMAAASALEELIVPSASDAGQGSDNAISVEPASDSNSIEMAVDNDGPPTSDLLAAHVSAISTPASAVILDVPTSYWTYGCSATAGGMLFAYYDRHGYANMYTGPTNGGVAPQYYLGQGDDPSNPYPGSCSIIATQMGFDGRSVRGHVDDYWVSYQSTGPDPWDGHWAEHPWGSCVADYLGTNQWKWDTDSNGSRDRNSDGATTYWCNASGSKLYDYIPTASQGIPQTELCHGLRLFAESRGYTFLENYTQKLNTVASGGFSFSDYRSEIDAGRPVLFSLDGTGGGHTVTGRGYDAATQTVYFNMGWYGGSGDLVAIPWGGTYENMTMRVVHVVHLAAPKIPGDATGDGKVDFNDYLCLEAYFGTVGTGTWAHGDFNNDKNVDFSDYLILEAHFGAVSALTSSAEQQRSAEPTLPELSSADITILEIPSDTGTDAAPVLPTANVPRQASLVTQESTSIPSLDSPEGTQEFLLPRHALSAASVPLQRLYSHDRQLHRRDTGTLADPLDEWTRIWFGAAHTELSRPA